MNSQSGGVARAPEERRGKSAVLLRRNKMKEITKFENAELIASNLIDLLDCLNNEHEFLKNTITTTINLLVNNADNVFEVKKHLTALLDLLIYSPDVVEATHAIYASEDYFANKNGEDYSKIDRILAFKINESEEK